MKRRNALKGVRLNLCHAVLAVALASCLAPLAAHSQSMETHATFNIPAGDLASSVDAFSRQSGLQILYKPELLAGRRAPALTGSLTNEDALKRLLTGTGVTWERADGTTYVLRAQKRLKRTGTPQGTVIEDAQSSGEEQVQELEKMIVVGSRLGVSPVDSAMPIQVITREQIDRSGSSNIAQALSYLSEVSLNSNGDRPIGGGDGLQTGGNTNATTVQMRGMPRGTVLILINGRRAGNSATYSSSGQFDLSSVPLSLVERIEVLPAGSSAIYGGDGLAGVVNVVLRRDANGLEMRYRSAHADGYPTRQASILWGKTWAKGDLTVAANWSDESSLYSTERELTADQDYRRFGGADSRSEGGNPATIFSLAGCSASSPTYCSLDLSLRGNLPELTSPVATAPANNDGVGLIPADFIATQGLQNRTSRQRNLRSAERNYGVSATGRLNLSGSVEAFAEMSATRRDVPAYEMPLSTTAALNGYGFSRMPATNPFNPFGVDVAVGFNFINTGVFSSYKQEYFRGAVGLRGKLKHFDWEISGWQARDESTTGGAMYFDEAAVARAMNSTNPATALNPFVSNGQSPGSTELMESLTVRVDGSASSTTTGLTGFIRGQPIDLPAGPLTALVGIEAQRQELDISTNNTAIVNRDVEGSTRSNAFFAEARLPLVSAKDEASPERLALTGAFRRESNDRFADDANTETLGIEYRPVSSLLLRGTYSTAFRPLLTYNAVLLPTYTTRPVTDPQFSGEVYNVRVRNSGGAPADLKPESSRNSTVGIVYRPGSDWSFSLTHWDMEFTDRIAYYDVQSMVNEEEFRPGRVTRNPVTGRIDEVDGRQVNIALVSAAGVDLAWDVGWETRIGAFRSYLAATYTYEHEQQATEKAPIVSGVGQLNSVGWAPRWKIVPRLSWDAGAFRTMLTGRYVSRYNDSTRFRTGPRVGEINELGEFWMFDLNVDIAVGKFFKGKPWLEGANLNFGSTNILNRLPDFCVGCAAAGYDASQYDIVGRTVYAELRMTF